MKLYIYILSLFFIVGMSSCSEDLQPNEVLLYGEIKGQGDEPLMIYYKSYENGIEILDTTIQFKNDKFEMKFSPKGGFGFHFIGKLNDNEPRLPIILENSEIKIEGVNNFFSDSKITGSLSNDLFKEFTSTKLKKYQVQRQVLSTKYNEAMALNDTIRINEMINAIDALTEEEHEMQTDFIREHPDNYFSFHIFVEAYIFYSSTYKDRLAMFLLFPDDIKSSSNGLWAKNILDREESLQNGKKVKNFKIPSLSNKNEAVELHDFVKEHKITLIDFWASWCQPCRTANVMLGETYSKYNRVDFEILAFSLDADLEAWSNACKDDDVSWISVCDKKSWKSDISKLFNVRVLPQNLLINSEGFILDQNIKPIELDSLVNHFLTVNI